MNRQQLIDEIKRKRSFLCIGLDTDISKIPRHLLAFDDPVFEFNKQVIDATNDLCVAYKINTAFYESRGLKGWKSLIDTVNYLPKDCFSIADAKRGDIGNTSEMYATAFFDPSASGMDFDAVTVAPYMGEDSVVPFLKMAGKWVILLAHTSNPGSNDFQVLQTTTKELVYEEVIRKSAGWSSPDQLMYVVGATKGEAFAKVRKLVPHHFLLVPGVGAQGGSLQDVCKYGWNEDCGLLINSSRSILYASADVDFAQSARSEAVSIRKEMEEIMSNNNFF